MKELLEYILKSILKDTNSLVIDETQEDETVTVYTIKIDEAQKGAVIGRGGRTIQSIRNLLAIKAVNEGKKVFVKVE